MNKKDIIILSAGSVLIIGAIVFIYFTFFQPKPKVVKTVNVVGAQTTITGKIDDVTLGKVNSLKNYVTTDLNNIGRVDPFGPLK